MRKRNNRPVGDQNGFIPMLICLALLIVTVVYFAYRVVSQAQH
ncbi:MAG TPA: hypothetical protein VGM08_02300 [Candidatus Saccharimonadales bacterium]|jgi:hypothetical protein